MKRPLPVRVYVDAINGTEILNYVLNWNDPSQRAVFAEQANNAIQAEQIITTMLNCIAYQET